MIIILYALFLIIITLYIFYNSIIIYHMSFNNFFILHKLALFYFLINSYNWEFSDYSQCSKNRKFLSDKMSNGKR